jgi:RNA polymerase sigma-70 factor (ECF subfamily)
LAVAYEPVPGSGTASSVEQLFWQHHERVLRAAYRVTGSLADAEDVAQNLFLRLASGPDKHIDNPGSYLHRAAINGALDLLRSRRDKCEVELDNAAKTSSDRVYDRPEQRLSDGDLRRELRQALTVLSPRTAEMFVLRYLEDYDNREIARLLGTSQAVVAVMLHHARKKLKKALRGKR